MEESALLKLKYPTGKFIAPVSFNREEINKAIDELKAFPAELTKAAELLSEDQLNRSYRPGGWTGRQVIHHVGDSHMNAFIRIKLALTEDNPTIKPYDENLWSRLADGTTPPVEISLKLIEALHCRMDILLRSLSDEEMQRTLYHPEAKKTYTIFGIVMLYRWHSYHHLGHVKLIKEQGFA
jgi:hypothetical protein